MSVLLMIMGRRRPGQSLADHRQHMQFVHGQLVLDYIAQAPEQAPRHYVQNHAYDGIFAAGDPAVDLLARGYDFMTEIGFETMAQVGASMQTPYYREKLIPDEALMVDPPRGFGTPFAMHEISAAPEAEQAPETERALAIKVFGVFAATNDQQALREGLAHHVKQSGLAEQARLRRQHALVPAKLDTVDTFWLPDAAAANRLATSYKAEVIDPMIAAGAIAANGAALILAREINMHATF
jgi:hypothetical protein